MDSKSLADPILKQIERVVLNNLDNDQLTVDEISSKIGISRSQLHRRLKQLADKSISQYVREIRLNEAVKLIKSENFSTKELAYKVGFSSSTYFNKCFHEYFGYTPSEIKSKVSLKRSEHQTKKKSIVLSILIPLTQSFWGVLAIILVVLGYISYANTPGNETENASEMKIVDKSIAVLPFTSLSTDPEKQYLADAVMDAILLHLSKIENLRVITRTSVEHYRNTTMTIPEIAAELNVHHILEGSFQKHGDKANLIVQLSNAQQNEDHIWANEYNRDWSDIFEVQSEVSQIIARELQAVITPEEEKLIEKFPTTNVAAYELYIRGNHEMGSYWSTQDQKHIHAARKLFDKALLIDPEYYGATRGKGDTFMAEKNYDSAFIYVDKLIVLDPKSGSAYRLKGECYFLMGKLDLAVENYKTAINISPPHITFWPHLQLGRTLVAKGDIIEALSYYSKALQLDNEDMVWAYVFLASAFANIGEYDRAARYLQTSMESTDHCNLIKFYASVLLVQGKFPQLVQFINSKCDQQACEQSCNQVMFQISLMQGEFVEAAEYSANLQNTGIEFYGIYPGYMDYEIGYVHYQLGRTDESDKIFKEEIQKLESIDHEAAVHYLHLSRIYAFKGERKKALENLNEYAKRGFTAGWHDFILIDPFFESFRDDPEFKAIVKQAQEEKAALREQVRQMEARGELDL